MAVSSKNTQIRAPQVNFMIAGAQKAGTTALSSFLSGHRDIFMPDDEVHFFDNDRADWDRPNYSIYHQNFRDAQSHQVVGEKTPVYMFWANSIERIQAYNPDMKILIVLRDPVQRAYSQWKMQVARGAEPVSFSDAIRGGRERISKSGGSKKQALRRFSYVERGFYAPQLERVLNHFPRNQILILKNEELRSDLAAVLDKITAFLRVAPFDPYPENEHIQPSIGGACLPKIEVAAPSDEDLIYLYDLYSDDIAKTAQLTGLDLSDWRLS